MAACGRPQIPLMELAHERSTNLCAHAAATVRTACTKVSHDRANLLVGQRGRACSEHCDYF
jgi:hypothetical protein